MYGAGGRGASSPKAVAFCREHGIEVIPGQYPFMFLSGTSGIHRLHGFVRKITGRYPRHSKAASSARPKSPLLGSEKDFTSLHFSFPLQALLPVLNKVTGLLGFDLCASP
jgi:hypothetical protein